MQRQIDLRHQRLTRLRSGWGAHRAWLREQLQACPVARSACGTECY